MVWQYQLIQQYFSNCSNLKKDLLLFDSFIIFFFRFYFPKKLFIKHIAVLSLLLVFYFSHIRDSSQMLMKQKNYEWLIYPEQRTKIYNRNLTKIRILSPINSYWEKFCYLSYIRTNVKSINPNAQRRRGATFSAWMGL